MAEITDMAPILVKHQICLYIKEVLITRDLKIFSSLPTYIKDIPSIVKEFKLLLKNFLYFKSFYMFEEYFQYNNI